MSPRMSNAGTVSRDDWETPDELMSVLRREFGPFDLDAAASQRNHKAPVYFGPDQAIVTWRDGLTARWFGKVYVNPPYGRGVIEKWAEKCYREVECQQAGLVIALLPVSTGSAWWHEWIWKATEIRFLKGRLTFKGAPAAATWDSVIVIWRRGQLGWNRVTGWDWRKQGALL